MNARPVSARPLKFLSATLFLLAGLAAWPAPSAAAGNAPLFSDDATRGSRPADRLAVAREKKVVLNVGALESALARGTGRFDAVLFDGVPVTVDLDRVDRRGPRNFTWFGRVEGAPQSQVVLTVIDGRVSASIDLGDDRGLYDGYFRLETGPDGSQWLREIDQRRFPPDHPTPSAPVPPKSAMADPVPSADVATMASAADSGITIDVMVVYTNQTAAAAGSAIGTQIQNAIDTANATYANSGVGLRLRLVYATQVNYSESGNFNTDLDRLTTPGDGYMDEVQALRDSYGADLVSLFVEESAYCGIGWIGPSAGYGFTVVNRGCASGNYSFPHELGHNMGARHDPYVDASTSPTTYGHGYVNAGERWRTVMAYNNQCSDAGFNCTRVAYWSNPAVSYPATGSAMGTNESGTTPTSNNTRLLNNNALAVAGFRASVGTAGCTYALSPTSAALGAPSASSSVTVTTQAGCAWNAVSSATWLALSSTNPTSGPGTLAYSVAANAGAARTATITVGSQAFTVNQASGCTYAISPASASYGAAGGSGVVTLSTGTGCAWTASSGATWINGLSATSGSGSANLTYHVDANAGAARTGNMTIAGSTMVVSQGAAAGTASAGVATLGAASIGFGTVRVGRSSGAKSVTLSNTGSASLSITALTPGGANPGDFVRSGTCAAGLSLSAGQTCTITYVFAPTASGNRTANLTVATNGGSPVLGLSGKGR